MPFVIFVAPMLSDTALHMVDAAAGLGDVRMGVITQDNDASLRHLQGRVAHWRVDDVLDAGTIERAARELKARNGDIHRLFGAYEQLQVPLAMARESLGVDGLSVRTATNFRDKARMKTLLREHGVPCARHQLATTAEQGIDFGERSGVPIVLKPPSGAGAVQTFRVDSMDELRRALAIYAPSPTNPALLEEFIVGAEHSFETISIDGKAVWHSLTHYSPTPLHVVEHPWIQWCLVLPHEIDSPAYDDIREAGRRTLDVLGMTTGLTHMEWFRRTDGSIAISEVAARPPGAQITTMISRANDIDFVQAWARVMIFGEFTIPARKYAVGAAFLRGQGRGMVRAVHGWDIVQRDFGPLVCDVRLPSMGTPSSSSYEGEGFVIVRHADTAVVEDAVSRIVSVMRIELV